MLFRSVAFGEIPNGTGDFTCTFGNLSSTSSTNNIILVRFKLTAGDTINRLEFRGII